MLSCKVVHRALVDDRPASGLNLEIPLVSSNPQGQKLPVEVLLPATVQALPEQVVVLLLLLGQEEVFHLLDRQLHPLLLQT